MGAIRVVKSEIESSLGETEWNPACGSDSTSGSQEVKNRWLWNDVLKHADRTRFLSDAVAASSVFESSLNEAQLPDECKMQRSFVLHNQLVTLFYP